MPIETFLSLLLFCFVAAASPGPNNTMLFASGVNFGFARTLPHMAGITIGFTLMVACVGLGLGAVLEAVSQPYREGRSASDFSGLNPWSGSAS